MVAVSGNQVRCRYALPHLALVWLLEPEFATLPPNMRVARSECLIDGDQPRKRT